MIVYEVKKNGGGESKMRKTIRTLIFILSVLTFYTGCDGDGGGKCNNCPCNFFSVPMELGCWSAIPGDNTFESDSSAEIETCDIETLFGRGIGVFNATFFDEPSGDDGCRIEIFDFDFCRVTNVRRTGLDGEQVEACRTCLEEYATELNNSGITVTGGPPYICVGP